MPRPARFKIAIIQDLLRQLTFAPAETRRRHMDAAERLISDIDPQQNYPQEFIVFRITGYRSDRAQDPVTLVGQALLPDLVNLVQQLSESLTLRHEEVKRQPIAIREVAARLNVSQKSIQRYRKQGLVCHWISDEKGTPRLVCFEDALERFVSQHQDRLKQAATFSRVRGEANLRIIEEARRLRAEQKLSLNEAALQISRQVGRAHETVRMILRRHDRNAQQPIFAGERGPLSKRDVAMAHRAWMRGIEPAAIARRLQKTRPTVHRAIARARRDLISALQLTFLHLSTFDLPDAEQVILSAPSVDSGLQSPEFARVSELIENVRDLAFARGEEDALIAAYNLLKMRASNRIALLGRSSSTAAPASTDLDAIEADLRWTAMLKRKLVLHTLGAAVRRIEQHLGRPLTQLPVAEISQLIVLAVEITAGALEGVDPSRGQKLERVAGFALEKALAQSSIISHRATSRAAIKRSADAHVVHDPFERLSAWESALSLRRDLRLHVAKLADSQRRAITLRYGLADSPPLTTSAIAQQLGMSPGRTARLLQQAMRELRACARAAGNV